MAAAHGIHALEKSMHKNQGSLCVDNVCTTIEYRSNGIFIPVLIIFTTNGKDGSREGVEGRAEGERASVEGREMEGGWGRKREE